MPAFLRQRRQLRNIYGQVVFGGVAVPGATVTATQGDMRLTTSTDAQGIFRIADIADGTWTIEIEMRGFATLTREVTIGPDAQPVMWETDAAAVRGDHARTAAASAPPARRCGTEQHPDDDHALADERAGRPPHDRLSTCRRDDGPAGAPPAGRGAAPGRSARRCGGGRRRIPDQRQRQQRRGVAVRAAGRVRQQPAAARRALQRHDRRALQQLGVGCQPVFDHRRAGAQAGLLQRASARHVRRASQGAAPAESAQRLRGVTSTSPTTPP